MKTKEKERFFSISQCQVFGKNCLITTVTCILTNLFTRSLIEIIATKCILNVINGQGH